MFLCWKKKRVDTRTLDARTLDARTLDARTLDARTLDARSTLVAVGYMKGGLLLTDGRWTLRLSAGGARCAWRLICLSAARARVGRRVCRSSAARLAKCSLFACQG